MQTPQEVHLSGKFIETVVLAALSGGASWLVTWGTFRERMRGLDARVDEMGAVINESIKKREVSIAHLTEGKADKTDVTELRNELMAIRGIIQTGFDRINDRMDRARDAHKP